jgi:hypothetical protein
MSNAQQAPKTTFTVKVVGGTDGYKTIRATSIRNAVLKAAGYNPRSKTLDIWYHADTQIAQILKTNRYGTLIMESVAVYNGI